MDVDLMGPDVDALDQRGKEGTLAWSGQCGPALPDLRGACHEPALRFGIGKPCRFIDAAGIEKPLTQGRMTAIVRQIFDQVSSPSRSPSPLIMSAYLAASSSALHPCLLTSKCAACVISTSDIIIKAPPDLIYPLDIPAFISRQLGFTAFGRSGRNRRSTITMMFSTLEVRSLTVQI